MSIESKAADGRKPNKVRAPRRVYERPVGMLFKGVYFVCQGLQISEGGMLIGIDLALMPGDWALMTILLPNGAPVLVRGEILYRQGKTAAGLPEFGLRFIDVKLVDRRQIRNYVSAKTRAEASRERRYA